MPKFFYRYLVASAGGDMRVTVRAPLIKANEIAYKIRLIVPDSPWGNIAGAIDVAVPVVAAPSIQIDPLAMNSVTRAKKQGGTT